MNFFQPSFKLKSKTRDGSKVHKVHKVYFKPATPCDRLLAHGSIDPAAKALLKAQFESLDPVRLLQEVRTAQQTLSEFAAHATPCDAAPIGSPDVDAFIKSLSTAWKDGEARPTHRKQAGAKHWWRTKVDPSADAWPLVDGWLIAEPAASAKELMNRLATMFPEAYAGNAQLRTLQRRVKAWRAERAKELIMGKLREPIEAPDKVPAAA